jgi:hypothetical protein
MDQDLAVIEIGFHPGDSRDRALGHKTNERAVGAGALRHN